MESLVSSLSRLSASQVERASFTPGSRTLPKETVTKLPGESVSGDALQALQRQLAEQDARISLLEKELGKSQLERTKSAGPTVEDGKEYVTRARSESMPSLNSKPAQPQKGAASLARLDDGVISSQLRYQMLQFKLYSMHPRRSSAVEDSPPLSSPPGQSPESSFFDDLSPASDKPATPSQEYSLDDLRAFESHLEMKEASSWSGHGDGVQRETTKALLEGIESPTDILQEYGIVPGEARTKRASRPTPMPWDGKVKYSLPTSSPFDDAHQKKRALNAQHHSKYPPGHFQHGLFFVRPKTEGNCCRTVAVTNLPLSCCLRHLFQGVRGGTILSAHLMNMERAAGYHMGIVTFVSEKDARAYVEFSKNHGVFFDDQRARVIMFKQPTYPMSVDIERRVSHGHTRCISIKGPRDPERYTDVAAFVERRLPVYFDLGDDMVENASRTEMRIHFNSIKAASAAMEAFRGYERLANCEMSFALDPCSRPLPVCPCHQ
ncbi:hypothetical protein ACJ73_01192 [Blastomyces percursus]|uniref:Uncharacterized protein n=1 Tax=Blastomyces percursus TaxID=1658174 RepID=A0A1J9QH48_9EURO|nr:hypothetical protein ACJ73_01192 [Blastomyces percursus]